MNLRYETPVRSLIAVMGALALLASWCAFGMDNEKGMTRTYAPTPPAPERQTAQDALAKSLGCVSCHTATDHTTMHVNTGVILGCTDCHGGDVKVAAAHSKVLDVLTLTRMSKVFGIYPDVNQARLAFRPKS